MKTPSLVGGLVAAAAIVGALVFWPHAVAPVDPPTAPKVVTPAPIAPPPAPPTAAPPVVAPPTGPAPTAAVDDPEHPGTPPGKRADPLPAPKPLTKQEKLDLLAPALPDLERRVARLRQEADADERNGNADAAKIKRVAADRQEKRLGQIRAAVAAGELPPNWVNPSHEK